MSSIENNDYYNIIKKIFDEIDDEILKSHERDNSQTIPNVEDVTHDQKDKSIVNILDVTADDELLLCIADGVVKNKKDENDNICSVADLPSQETMISDLSDDESSPKKLKQFTYTDSDLPDSEEIEEFLKAYPRPRVTYFPWIESESQSYSNEESNWLSRRRRKKIKPVTLKITIEKLPERFMTRQRKANIYLVTKKDCYRVLQSTYLKKHEDQTDEEIIRENIKRLKTSNKNKISKSKDTQSKSFAKNHITHDIISNVKTTTRRTRYMNNKSDGINNKNKSISIRYYKNYYKRKRALKKEISILPTVKGRRSKRNQKTKEKDEDTMKAPVSVPKSEDKNNKNKNISPRNYKNDFRPKRALKKERSTLPAVEGRRSKRNQTTKEKDEDTMKAPVSVPKSEDKNNKNKNIPPGNDKNDFIRKRALKKERSTLPAVEGRRSKRNQKTEEKDVNTMAPVSVPKKRVHEQRTVSSSESPKGLKRSLVEDIDVPFPKRTRSHNNKITNAPTSVRPTKKIRGLEPDKRVRNAPERRGRKA